MGLSERDWAAEQLSTLSLGDVRRDFRARAMLRRMAEQPAGRVSEVFDHAAERQAAYDFLESEFETERLAAALADATLRAARGKSFVFVAVDGSSVTLTDRAQRKDFGGIGQRRLPTRGLKLIDALAIEPNGTPLGLVALRVWARKPLATAPRFQRRHKMTTEVSHWVSTLEQVNTRLTAVAVRPWFLVDREGDCADMLRSMSAGGTLFTVRSNQNRRLHGSRRLLRAHMARQPIVGQHVVTVERNGTVQRLGLDLRTASVVLDVPNYTAGTKRRARLEVNVVWVRERTSRADRLDWMLLTNHPIDGVEQALTIVNGYCNRWRIEDFHRTWKSGRCRIEQTQLHRREHVVRWITMHAAVATRIERLKHLARTQPDAPATIELSELEIEALRLRKTAKKKRNEIIPEGIPPIRLAVLWLAELGSYAGKPTDNPGSITIGRGLERLMPFVDGLRLGLEIARRKDQW